MSEELERIILPIDGNRFETSRGIYTARLKTKPDRVVRGDRATSTICHNITFEKENGEKRDMRFWLPPEFIVTDPSMESTHDAALNEIENWLESDDFNSDQEDYWLNENLKLERFEPFGQ